MNALPSDREIIHDLLVNLFVAVDEKDWDRARAALADTVAFDVTSLAGGEAADVAADDIVAGWTDGLTPVREVHHQVSNFRFSISGDRATARCYGIAYHYNRTDAGPTVTTFVGTYDFGLTRAGDEWFVDALRFNKKFVDTRPAAE